MFIIIGIMFGGIGIGYLLRKVAILQKLNLSISYTIYLLLFLLGISVGNNETIMNNLGTLGLEAALIAIAATAGSVIAAWFVYKVFFKQKEIQS